MSLEIRQKLEQKSFKWSYAGMWILFKTETDLLSPHGSMFEGGMSVRLERYFLLKTVFLKQITHPFLAIPGKWKKKHAKNTEKQKIIYLIYIFL